MAPSVLLGAVAAGWVFWAPGYWVFTANAGLILAVSTLGLLIVVGWAGEVSLVQAGLTGTAVYVCAWADRAGNGLGWPFLAAAGLGIGVVVALSVLVALATARLSGIYLLVLTLALQVTIEQTVFTYPGMTQAGEAAVSSRPSLLGVTLVGDRSFYLFSLFVVGSVLLLLAQLRASRFGRGLVLVGTDRQVASAVGVSPWRAKIFAFALAGFCAGVAGALTAPLYTTVPGSIAYTAFNSLFYLAIPVLAGFRSLVGVAAVAMAFVVAPQALESYRIHPFVLGAAGLLLGTLAGRGGLSGLILERLRSWKPSRRDGSATVDVRTLAERAAGADQAGREQVHERALAVLKEYFQSRPGEGDILVARDVSVAFGGVQALDKVSLAVPAGSFVGLIGPNGAGKTTLFDVINGLRAPDSGHVLLLGRDISTSPAWDRAALGLSRTFQASRVDLDLSVAENLLFGAYTRIPANLMESILALPRHRAGMRRAENAAWAIAELLDIDRYWDEPARVLSFGNRRRVEIGRSLMSGPRLLLLDEPSAGLDPTAARHLFSLVKQIHRDLGLSVLLVEHYVPAVLENCDLIYVLSEGRIVAVGSPEEVASHPGVRDHYLGADFQFRAEVGGTA
jgi:ABC-type branched-subunit amino acid transport system ATPase component/ABC-type branched-subunit amino acid transport system permease subunit